MYAATALDRRTFLKSASAAIAIAALGPHRGSVASADQIARGDTRTRSVLSPDEFRKQIVGPIFSLPTPFTATFDVDHAGIRKSVDRAAKAGIKLFMLTSGNGEYESLTYDEIKAVTKSMVEAVAGRGLVVAASGGWWTAQAIDYAKYAESLGADAVQIQIPTRRGGDDTVVKHYKEVSAATKLPIVLHGDFSAALLRKLLPEVPAVSAMKEDVTFDYYIARQIEFGDRIAIFSGGMELRLLVGTPYGSHAFYSAYAVFAPDVSMKYWEAYQAGDVKKVAALVRKYDYPYLQKFSKQFWHGSMEYFGVAQRYLRPPVESYTDEQMKELKPFFDGQGLDPKAYQS
jgi:dihydrodipicolinate synthase/N-acetylneuraminate lyase